MPPAPSSQCLKSPVPRPPPHSTEHPSRTETEKNVGSGTRPNGEAASPSLGPRATLSLSLGLSFPTCARRGQLPLTFCYKSSTRFSAFEVYVQERASVKWQKEKPSWVVTCPRPFPSPQLSPQTSRDTVSPSPLDGGWWAVRVQLEGHLAVTAEGLWLF